MLKKIAFALTLSSLFAPLSFADDMAEEAVEEMSETEATLCGGGCSEDYYYGSNEVYFTVNTTVSVEADKVYVYGSYTVENAATRKEAVAELREVYENIQDSLAGYGTVRRTSLYTYLDWEYTNMYDANLSVRVDLKDLSTLSTVEDLMYDEGFDNWYEAVVTDTTVAESKAAKSLRTMISEKKEVYEEILDDRLGEVDGLSLYSWPDSSTFDEATGMVDVYVSASVWYYRD